MLGVERANLTAGASFTSSKAPVSRSASDANRQAFFLRKSPDARFFRHTPMQGVAEHQILKVSAIAMRQIISRHGPGTSNECDAIHLSKHVQQDQVSCGRLLCYIIVVDERRQGPRSRGHLCTGASLLSNALRHKSPYGFVTDHTGRDSPNKIFALQYDSLHSGYRIRRRMQWSTIIESVGVIGQRRRAFPFRHHTTISCIHIASYASTNLRISGERPSKVSKARFSTCRRRLQPSHRPTADPPEPCGART